MADQLRERGITYAPDYLVNSGGVIQVADELHGFDFERARERTLKIFDATASVLAEADAEGISPSVAADRLAERRIAARGAVRAAVAAGSRRQRLAGGRAPTAPEGPIGSSTAAPGAAESSEHLRTMYRCVYDETTEPGAATRRPGLRMRGSTPWVAAEPRPSRPRSPGS